MKTQKIKWDEGMAVRCLARVIDNGLIAKHSEDCRAKKAVKAPVKACLDKDFAFDIVKGEWDDFRHAINTMVRKYK